jgi:hypothetical protein
VSDEAAPAILGRYVPVADHDQVTVTLLNFPLQVFADARQHHDELLREFALLALRPPEDRPGHTVPAQLLDLIDSLGRRFGGVGDRTDALREAALARGETTMDLSYSVPRSAGPALRELHALMEQADAFCQTEELLTIAATPVERRFREWFIDEFIGQADSRPPNPWDGPLVPDRAPGT